MRQPIPPSQQPMKWYVLHTENGTRERELRERIEQCPDVSEAYYPLTKRTKRLKNGETTTVTHPLIPSTVFVRCSLIPVRRYITDYTIPGSFILDSTRDYHSPMVIPDSDMREFRQLWDNYNEQILCLNNSYETFRNCDIVTINNGLFQGMRGKFKEIRHDYKLIVQVGTWTLALSNIQRYTLTVNCSRPKNTEQDMLFQLIDKCLSHLHALGHVDNAPALLRLILSTTNKEIRHADNADSCIRAILARHTDAQQSDLLTLSDNLLMRRKKFEYDTQIPSSPIRPFLTIHSGYDGDITTSVEVTHRDFTEIITREDITETFLVSEQTDKTREETNPYYAHVAVKYDDSTNLYTLLTNWTDFYSYYTTLDDKQKFHDKLLQYGSTLFHSILTATCPDGIRFRTLQLGGEKVTGISIEAEAPTLSVIRHLIDTSRQLCEEIIGNTHLLPWRRHLSTVWFRI